ncbi:MAG: hypothetical protein HeimC3_40780, partial [Candidatus Heimdallarchaeota archaeon LC_3]
YLLHLFTSDSPLYNKRNEGIEIIITTKLKECITHFINSSNYWGSEISDLVIERRKRSINDSSTEIETLITILKRKNEFIKQIKQKTLNETLLDVLLEDDSESIPILYERIKSLNSELERNFLFYIHEKGIISEILPELLVIHSNHIFDWITDSLEIQDKKIQYYLRRFLIEKRLLLFADENNQKILIEYLRRSQNDLNIRTYYTIALVSEYFDEQWKNEALGILIVKKDSLSRAIAFRILAEKTGINITKVMSKASTCNKYKTGRPIIWSSFNNFNESPRDGYSRFVTNDEIITDTRINFGILYFDEFEPLMIEKGMERFLKTITLDNPYLDVHLFPKTDYSSIDKSRINLAEWIQTDIPKRMGVIDLRSDKFLWLLQGLKDSEETIVLSLLFYLEDLIFNQKHINITNSFLEIFKTLKIHDNKLIKVMASYIYYLMASETQQLDFLRENQPTKETLHGFLWAVNTNVTKNLDNKLKIYLENITNHQFIEILEILVPWILLYEQSFMYCWFKIVTLEQDLIESELMDKGYPKTPYYFFHRSLYKLLDIPSHFITEYGCYISNEVNYIIDSLNSNSNWNISEINVLVANLKAHTHKSLSNLGIIIELTLLYPQTLKFFAENFTLSQLNLSIVISLFSKLNYQQQEKVINHIFENNTKEYNIYKITLLNELNEINFTDHVVNVLDIITTWIKKNSRPNRIYSIVDTWELSPRHRFYEIVRDELENIVEKNFESIILILKDNLNFLPLNRLSRRNLLKMYAYIKKLESQDYKWTLYTLYELLYPKTWYNYSNIFESIVNND